MRVFCVATLCLPMGVWAQSKCAPAGEWTIPGVGRVAGQEILARAVKTQVVLLGESHDNADHHRWQLQTLAALAALHPKLIIGFEMFPRRVQPVLDRWVAGELGEQEFLKATDWGQVWGYDAALYLPLFHFARLNRIRMLALNVESSLVRAVSTRGLAAIPVEQREKVSDAAPATPAYLDWLFPIYAEHRRGTTTRSDPEFVRFVESQLVWDRALAQALAENAGGDALVIGIMGSGHVLHGHGVPRQLRDLGVARVEALLPWTADTQCREVVAGLATAVFGIAEARPGPERPLLGITVETAAEGVRVTAVRPGSIAEAAGLKEGDTLLEVAGVKPKLAADVRAVVESMAPGTWLPLKTRRGNETLDLLAKFPTRR